MNMYSQMRGHAPHQKGYSRRKRQEYFFHGEWAGEIVVDSFLAEGGGSTWAGSWMGHALLRVVWGSGDFGCKVHETGGL